MNPILYTEETTSAEYWEIRFDGYRSTLYRVFGPHIEDRIECGRVVYRTHSASGKDEAWNTLILDRPSSTPTIYFQGDRGNAIEILWENRSKTHPMHHHRRGDLARE